MKVLYIGGTGEISYECVKASLAAGHDCTVFNRGLDRDPLPPGVQRITGDLANSAEYARLGDRHFDVVCQFKAYLVEEARRDIETFGGRCGQYVFISTASAYQKPPAAWRITEETPLHNPYWTYSQRKADMERMLLEAHARGQLPVTIVRPTLTYRRRFPSGFISGDDLAWRMLQGKSVIVHGDGQTLWTLTHARDFAQLIVPLLGNAKALGGVFQVMTDTAYTWDYLTRAVATTLGVEPKLVYVPTQTLVRYNAEWTGPLLGDKSWTTLFDTSKIERFSGRVVKPVGIEEGFAGIRPYLEARMAAFQPDLALHALLDRIAHEQESLGVNS